MGSLLRGLRHRLRLGLRVSAACGYLASKIRAIFDKNEQATLERQYERSCSQFGLPYNTLAPRGADMLDPDDTSRCPVSLECETCGRLDELAVSTAETPDGTVCMTLCDVCEVTGALPILGPAALSTRVVEHGEHLGVVGPP